MSPLHFVHDGIDRVTQNTAEAEKWLPAPADTAIVNALSDLQPPAHRDCRLLLAPPPSKLVGNRASATRVYTCRHHAPGGAEELLRRANAREFGHANQRSLYDHLVATKAILRRWLQPAWLQEAGAIHSIYSTDAYRKELIPLSRRNEVRDVVGERAERLAYLFCILSRESFFDAMQASPGLPRDGIVVARARGPGTSEQLSCHEAQHLLLVHMANLAEQSRGPANQPGRWLAGVSAMGSKLDETLVIVPPPFASFTRVVAYDQEDRARGLYLRALQAGDSAAGAEQFSAASRVCPCVAEPRIACACAALKSGNLNEARTWIAGAHRALVDLGVAWDPRLSYDDWLQLIAALQSTASGCKNRFRPSTSFNFAAVRELFNAIIPGATAIPAEGPDSISAGPAGVSRFHRYVDSFAGASRSARRHCYPGLSSKPWYEPASFALAEDLEAHYRDIRLEINRVKGQGFHRESEGIGRRGAWDVFMLYERGRKKEQNCARCPTATRIIERHDTLRSQAGLIYFSRMKPGTHIAAHRGPTNLRLRCHLGIQVPAGDCAIRVGAEPRHWQEGKCLVFNDYFEHEAWNHTAQERLVLIVDFWHPDLSPAEVRLLEGLHRYTFDVARSLTKYWATNARAARLER